MIPRARGRRARVAGPSSKAASFSQAVCKTVAARPDPTGRSCDPARRMAWSWDLLRLEHCPFRQDTLAGVAPQGDQELSGESHDRDPPDPPATLPDTLAEPGAQGRVRADSAATAKRARPWRAAGVGCRTWRCPVLGWSRRSAMGLAPSRRTPPPVAGWRSGGTRLPATAARRARDQSPSGPVRRSPALPGRATWKRSAHRAAARRRLSERRPARCAQAHGRSRP